MLEWGSESRRLLPDELPLSLGGAGCDLVLPAAGGAGPVAHLGASEGALFVQPVDGRDPIVCNGSRLESSQWLRDGDVLLVGGASIFVERRGDDLRISVREREGRSTTPPPPIATGGGSATAGGGAADGLIYPAAFEPVALAAHRRRSRLPRLATLALWLLVALLAGAAWFVLTARGITLEIEPEPDRAAFDAPWTPRLGASYLLRPGSHRLVAEKEGYRRLDTTIEVTRDSPARLRFTLEPLPPRLSIVVEPEVPAEIEVDGRPVGTAPIAPVEVELGAHRVVVRASGFRDFAAEVSLDEAGGLKELVAVLEANTATVGFSSRPEGATVKVDGVAIGRTPLETEIEEGSHRVNWLLAGYKPATTRLEVAAGQGVTHSPPPLVPADGNVLVESEPAGVTVTVDGQYRGTTPLDLELAPGTDHRLRFSKAGYEPRDEELRVAPSESRRIAVELERQLAEVEVQSRPTNADVVVDGTVRGTTGAEGLTLSLPAGAPVRLEIRKQGYESHSATVTPRADRHQTVNVELTTPEERAAARTPARIAPDHGHEMVLVRGGRFTMGASRREPGRRSNEARREVELARPFYLSTREVTNRQFRKFSSGHLSGKAGAQNLEIDDHPAVRVTWEQAARYCNWLSERESLPPVYAVRGGRLVARTPVGPGYRLPTEAEWAWVARLPTGDKPQKYAWGDALPIVPGSGNYGSLPGWSDAFPGTAPVDSLRPDRRGFYHLGGNVAEWMHDVYRERPATTGVERDPTGAGDGTLHTIRGASWMTSTLTALRLTYRDSGAEGRPDVGFRIARYAE